MAINSKIEWTESTWNPVTGCTKISPGCDNCYAERISLRLKGMGQNNYRNGFEVTLHDHTLKIPLKWTKPKIIFVNSMSDLFHNYVPEDFILKVFNVMLHTSNHIFQVLTKRSGRLMELNKILPWAPNIWMGVSIENSDYLFRMDHLKNTDSKLKFISFEPLIGPIPQIDLKGINWVIVGGESGPRARYMKPEWVRIIRDQCIQQNTPFFFKQWGGINKKENGRKLDGIIWDQMPDIISCISEKNLRLAI